MIYNFSLSEQEAQLVINALAEQPYKLVAELLQNLMQQVHEQKADPTKDSA